MRILNAHPKIEAPPGWEKTIRVGLHRVDITFVGHVTPWTVHSVKAELARLQLSSRDAVIFDMLGVESFDISVQAPGMALLAFIRNAGVKRVAAAVRLASVRMMGTALGFGVGLRLEMVATFPEAVAAIERMPVETDESLPRRQMFGR